MVVISARRSASKRAGSGLGVWIQLLIGWLPAWALFALLMFSVHGIAPGVAALYALRVVALAALLGLAVQRLTQRWPWPYPFRAMFVLRHALAGVAYALSWTTHDGRTMAQQLRGVAR